MENQATFDDDGSIWTRASEGGVNRGGGPYAYKWRSSDSGNQLMVNKFGTWTDDANAEPGFDDSCKRALRALIGPPPWETPAVATRDRIKALGDKLCALSNEAECGFAELSRIAIDLVGEQNDLQGECTRLKLEADNLREHYDAALRLLVTAKKYSRNVIAERDQAVSNWQTVDKVWASLMRDHRDLTAECDALRAECTRLRVEMQPIIARRDYLESKLAAIRHSAEGAERMAGVGTREETIRAAAETFRVIFADSGYGVMIPEVLDCPYGEPYHDHSDGCPCCMEVEEWAGEIADEILDVEVSSIPYSDLKSLIFRCLQERRVYPKAKEVAETRCPDCHGRRISAHDSSFECDTCKATGWVAEAAKQTPVVELCDGGETDRVAPTPAIIAPDHFDPLEWRREGDSVIFDNRASWVWLSPDSVKGPTRTLKAGSFEARPVVHALRTLVGPPPWEANVQLAGGGSIAFTLSDHSSLRGVGLADVIQQDASSEDISAPAPLPMRYADAAGKSLQVLDADKGIVDLGDGPRTLCFMGHELKGFIPADQSFSTKDSPAETTDGSYAAELQGPVAWSEEEIIEARAAAIVIPREQSFDDRVRELVNEEFARAKAEGVPIRIMTEDRVREICREETESRFPVSATIADAMQKSLSELIREAAATARKQVIA